MSGRSTPGRAASLAAQRRLALTTRRLPAWTVAIFSIGAAIYAVLFLGAIGSADSELLHGLTVLPVLLALTIPIALRIARSDDDPALFAIVMAGVVTKLLTAYLRFFVSFEVYSTSDAAQYHRAALELAPRFRDGIFDPGIGSLAGTNFIKVASGVVYAIFGVSLVSAFFIFSWLAFLGLLLLARAFKIAIPSGDSKRYMILVLFLPSLAYWSSALGKEAWMTLAIGLCAYGVACLLRGRSVGFVSLGIGLVASLVVRPHISLMVFIGLLCALVVRRAPARSYASPLFRMLSLLLMLVLGIALAGRTASFVDRELQQSKGDDLSSTLTLDGVTNTLSDTERQTADGGSEFTPVTVNTPLDLPLAIVTVYFRPFPFEASNAQSLLSAAEGILLALLILVSWKRIRATPRLIRTAPYLAFCLGYLFVFAYAFSSFSNFGILARQRVQALPFLLVFLALPDVRTLPAKLKKPHFAQLRPPPTTHRRAR